jgi:hypothetical protein
MPDVETRLDGVERGLSAVKTEVGELRGEVQKLKVLEEENCSQIKLIAEVQATHGEKLDVLAAEMRVLKKAVEPIADMHAFIKSVAHDHELRIRALERRSDGSLPA